MTMAVSSIESKSYSDINMTPLIDVMLVLLIIFIITIPSQTDAVKIDNPSHDQRLLPHPEVIDLSIDFDGTLQWNKATVDRAALQSYIAHEAAKNPQPEVHLAVDKFS
jgi:biopolymer transport protein ExbD